MPSFVFKTFGKFRETPFPVLFLFFVYFFFAESILSFQWNLEMFCKFLDMGTLELRDHGTGVFVLYKKLSNAL